jgi:prophage antirepressor-like protein
MLFKYKSNIRTSIQQFDDTERHVHTMDTSTGPKQVTFLTEKGLYKVLFKSRKPIAEKFQDWVCEVIKELRLKGTYDLQQQLEQAKIEITQIISDKTLEKALTKNILYNGNYFKYLGCKTKCF